MRKDMDGNGTRGDTAWMRRAATRSDEPARSGGVSRVRRCRLL